MVANNKRGPKILYPSGKEKYSRAPVWEAEYFDAPAIQSKYFVEPKS